MKNETLSDSTLLESALQTLRAIAGAKKFKDQDGDKMIMSTYADLAASEVRLVETKRATYQNCRTAEEIRQSLGHEDLDPDGQWENATGYHGEND